MLGMAADVEILIAFYIVGALSIAETIRKDLILHSTLCPGRYVKTGSKTEGILLFQRFLVCEHLCSDLGISNTHAVNLQNKGITGLFLQANNARLKPVKSPVRTELRHQNCNLRLKHEQHRTGYGILRRTDADMNGLIGIRLTGRAEHLRLIAENAG